MKYLIDKMNCKEVSEFLRIHTIPKYAHLKIGTNPVTNEEIAYARKRHRDLNHAAFERDTRDYHAEQNLLEQELEFNNEF